MTNILNQIEKLNSECFIYENYESNWWCLLDLDYMAAMDVENVMKAVEQYAVGYCESS
jgi:hypothetical protein